MIQSHALATLDALATIEAGLRQLAVHVAHLHRARAAAALQRGTPVRTPHGSGRVAYVRRAPDGHVEAISVAGDGRWRIYPPDAVTAAAPPPTPEAWTPARRARHAATMIARWTDPAFRARVAAGKAARSQE